MLGLPQWLRPKGTEITANIIGGAVVAAVGSVLAVIGAWSLSWLAAPTSDRDWVNYFLISLVVFSIFWLSVTIGWRRMFPLQETERVTAAAATAALPPPLKVRPLYNAAELEEMIVVLGNWHKVLDRQAEVAVKNLEASEFYLGMSSPASLGSRITTTEHLVAAAEQLRSIAIAIAAAWNEIKQFRAHTLLYKDEIHWVISDDGEAAKLRNLLRDAAEALDHAVRLPGSVSLSVFMKGWYDPLTQMTGSYRSWINASRTNIGNVRKELQKWGS